MGFTNVLPDPSNQFAITVDSNPDNNLPLGDFGPGFATIKVTSNEKIMKAGFNSGIVDRAAASSHAWELNISYNPMPRAAFAPMS